MNSIAQIIGRMGYSNPPDAYSGVKIGDETYPVMLRNDGCYVYFDERGRKHNLSEVPRADYEYVNIKDARMAIENKCYRTPGGQVEARIHTYMNNEDEVLSIRIVIINSTDMDNPVGKEMTSIPTEWVSVDCSIAEMTDRELMYVDRCYETPDGKVNVVGMESLDPRLGMEVAVYEVLRTTDENIAVGAVYSVIPGTWTRTVCDFPDMTQREITPILKCYTTPGGKVQIEGYKVFDYEMTVRMEWYRIKRTTDPDNPVGGIIVGIPYEWEETVCDFTDLEDRDVEITGECYRTDGGKVSLEVTTSWDGDLGRRMVSYRVLESTDPAYPENTVMTSLDASFVRMECDFADRTQRTPDVYEACYGTPNGSVRLRFRKVVDAFLNEYDTDIMVLSSTDVNYPLGTKLTLDDIEGWKIEECDMPDLSQRFVTVEYGCVDTGNGIVKLRYRSVYDYYLDKDFVEMEVVSSTDPDFPVGYDVTDSDMVGWKPAECDIPDAGERHLMDVSECYDTGAGRVFLKGVVAYDNELVPRKRSLTVEESTDDSYAVGTVLTDIPDGFSIVPCYCGGC